MQTFVEVINRETGEIARRERCWDPRAAPFRLAHWQLNYPKDRYTVRVVEEENNGTKTA